MTTHSPDSGGTQPSDVAVRRLALYKMGYQPVPCFGKKVLVKNWTEEDYLKVGLLFARGKTPEQNIALWDLRKPDLVSTGVRVVGPLRVIDLDVDDPVLIDKLLAFIAKIAPEIAASAPERPGGGEKIALFCVAAPGTPEEELFERLASHKYHRPDDESVPVTVHAVEVYGSKRTGKCQRHFGVAGPHSYVKDEKGIETPEVARWYGWNPDRPLLHQTPLDALPVLTLSVAAQVVDEFDRLAVEAGWVRIVTELHTGGSVAYDLTDETRFNSEHGERGLSYRELCDLNSVRGEFRVSSSFITGIDTSYTKCWVKEMDGRARHPGVVAVFNHETQTTHYPVGVKPGLNDAEMAELAQMLRELPPPGDKMVPPRDFVITQDGIARVFASEYEGQLRFCHDTGAWFVWSDTHWKKDNTALAFYYCRQLGRAASMNSSSREMKEVRKVGFAGGVEKFAKTDRTFAVTSEIWDADPMLLGTPDGTVDLRTGRLSKSRSADGITKVTAVGPSKTAHCPRWLRFLDETFGGDAEMIWFVKQWCGYCLTGLTDEHALLFGFGNGKNGKSVWINTITGIMNDYAVTAPMETFVAGRFDRHPTELAMLRGARLVTASETEEGRSWAEFRIKSLTGGDPVTARFMAQNFFTFVPAFKLTIVGNHKPNLKNVDDAAKRRFNLAPFTRTPAMPDTKLTETLKAEWPGILRWMIEGCLDWQKHGLARPEVVLQATEDYFEEQDLMAQWLSACCDVRKENAALSAPSKALYESWLYFAMNEGAEKITQNAFTRAMTKRGFDKAKDGAGESRVLRGVRLKVALDISELPEGKKKE